MTRFSGTGAEGPNDVASPEGGSIKPSMVAGNQEIYGMDCESR